MNGHEENKDLEMVQRTFALSNTELAEIFSINRQALDYWHEHGVPSNRKVKLATVAALAEVLSHKLKKERIAAVVRRHADAHEGKSMLQLISEDQEARLLKETRAIFDWSVTA